MDTRYYSSPTDQLASQVLAVQRDFKSLYLPIWFWCHFGALPLLLGVVGGFGFWFDAALLSIGLTVTWQVVRYIWRELELPSPTMPSKRLGESFVSLLGALVALSTIVFMVLLAVTA